MRFAFVYTGGPAEEHSAAEMEAVMAAWRRWFASLGAAVVDIGIPYSESSTVEADSVSPGGASGLAGYSIVTAENLEGAVAFARSCPIIDGGGAVEVYQTHEM